MDRVSSHFESQAIRLLHFCTAAACFHDVSIALARVSNLYSGMLGVFRSGLEIRSGVVDVCAFREAIELEIVRPAVAAGMYLLQLWSVGG